jgi:hypothetical protein
VNVVFCQVEVSASGWSLVQRSLTECGVSECDHEASIMRRPWPIRGFCAMEDDANLAIFFVAIMSGITNKFRIIVATSYISSSLINVFINNYREFLIILPNVT